MSLFLIFFFFKQKTAYEMRISDWSSDVCSSDLECAAQRRKKDGDRAHKNEHRYDRTEQRAYKVQLFHGHPAQPQPSRRPSPLSRKPRRSRAERRMLSRSEEHTSELQSLMRISYAVFCLKTQKHNTQTQSNP